MDCDLLGLQHPKFKFDEILKALPKNSAVGFFHDTFGCTPRRIWKLLQSDKVRAIRVHINWDYNHKIVSLKKLKAALPFYEKLALEFPNVKVYVSHSCEHNERNKVKVENRMIMILDYAPHCIAVNSIWRGTELSGWINEYHGMNALACKSTIASMDGVDSIPADFKWWWQDKKDAIFRFLWLPSFNMKKSFDDSTAIEKRITSPRAKDIKNLMKWIK